MIELKHICKTFDSGGGEVEALKDVSLTIEKGEIYGIIGMSGAGKSTLVRCMNLLERPTSGEIWVNGQELERMTPKELRRARGEITMIFQHFNLLMQRTCLRNVCFPMELGGMKKADAEKRARELLDLVGLPGFIIHQLYAVKAVHFFDCSQNFICHFQRDLAAIGAIHFIAVVLGRVVAGCNADACPAAQIAHRPRKCGRGLHACV